MKSIKKHIIFLFSIALFSLPFYADVDTTSGMRGSVNVGGATIVAEHTPTGITKTNCWKFRKFFLFLFTNRWSLYR